MVFNVGISCIYVAKTKHTKGNGISWYISEFANSVFLLNGEGYINGTPFVIIMIAATLGLAHAIEKQTQKRKIKCYTKNI